MKSIHILLAKIVTEAYASVTIIFCEFIWSSFVLLLALARRKTHIRRCG